jgi:ABC-type spermidine/putrescine transport system permease subunit I
MRIKMEDLKRMLVVSLFSVPAIAFIIFDFVFPNISTPSLDKNMMAAFLLSLLFGLPPGYFLRRTDLAIVTVLICVFLGYLLALIAYSAPFIFYDFRVIFPGLYFMFFLNRTVVLIMLLFLGGVIGVVLGQMLRETMETEETAQWFPKP